MNLAAAGMWYPDSCHHRTHALVEAELGQESPFRHTPGRHRDRDQEGPGGDRWRGNLLNVSRRELPGQAGADQGITTGDGDPDLLQPFCRPNRSAPSERMISATRSSAWRGAPAHPRIPGTIHRRSHQDPYSDGADHDGDLSVPAMV